MTQLPGTQQLLYVFVMVTAAAWKLKGHGIALYVLHGQDMIAWAQTSTSAQPQCWLCLTVKG